MTHLRYSISGLRSRSRKFSASWLRSRLTKKQEPEPHLYRLLEDKKHKEIVHLLVCLSVRPSVCPFQMGQHLWKTIFKKVHFWVKIFGTSIPGIPGQIRKNCSRAFELKVCHIWLVNFFKTYAWLNVLCT